MNLPNLITIVRILLVPLTVWLILSAQFLWAFVAFVSAGISDGIDGFIAKRYGLTTDLGAHLDPLADKLLLVSIYVTLGFLSQIPAWLVILVVSRDVLIVGAVMLALVMDRRIAVKPLMISKINTVAQIALAGALLANLGLGLGMDLILTIGAPVVAALTLGSGALYMHEWVRHMANGSGGDGPG